ncbi:predicted protein [Plenodomus lingam JN3]|uniref:Predicted protein n=1 Tax=Leptosphaeria maculans (strain JN3 / isolate v23.1.3 / race Av1-4-5-6-7-8) TaxID=985895 RepID=E5A9R1_LEPMJ|nr:predicted protein [Plenodomus lingam JN3]CBY00402.1 predicted protein [Plenodomus lingam JN3]
MADSAEITFVLGLFVFLGLLLTLTARVQGRGSIDSMDMSIKIGQWNALVLLDRFRACRVL